MAGYYDEILCIVEEPDYVIKGHGGAFIALKQVEKNKFLAIVYKEISKMDGFIVTAYFTSKINIEREVIMWQRQK